MILIIGSSHSRGAWEKRHTERHGSDASDDRMLHNLISQGIGCDVVNLSEPGCGSERFLSAISYACSRYDVKLILAEAVMDRSFHHFSFPTKSIMEHLGSLSRQDVYESLHSVGSNRRSWVGSRKYMFCVDRFDSIASPVFGDPLDDRDSRDIVRRFRQFSEMSVYLDDPLLAKLRSVNNVISTENLSRIIGIPVLWWEYFDYDLLKGTVDDERNMNASCGIGSVIHWAEKRLDGREHLADECHLNDEAYLSVASELMIPFITSYAERHGISLR